MIEFPEFRSHALLKGGHRQTLIGFLFRGVGYSAGRKQHSIELPDGDRLILHDDQPESWQCGDSVALLLHGLAGCHGSAYMVRVGEKLNARGVRVFRLDHRGCGAGTDLARFPYNAGRSEDVRAAFLKVRALCPGSPSAIVGFSLSGNMLLKMLGEDSSAAGDAGSERATPTCAVAVNPPVDLALCGEALRRRENRLYERHFVKLLGKQVDQRVARFPDAPRPKWSSLPDRLRDFDDGYTAPASGFDGVEDYYERCSGEQFVKSIRVPTLVLTARDDPLIPVQSFESLSTEHVAAVIAPHGGHLGYIGTRNGDPDRRWMDWRIVDWLERHLD
jgi:uncharacterized protein